MKTLIRKSKITDLNEFIFMKGEYIKYFMKISGEKSYMSNKQIKKEFLDTLKKRNSNIYILEINKEICGFMKLNIIKNRIRSFSYLEDLFVKFDNRGKGYGNLLFKEFIKISKNKKVEKMGLGTRVENKRAISMNKKYGFKIIGYNFGKKLK